VYFSYEVPCKPVCETESPTSAPTPCIEKAKSEFLESLGFPFDVDSSEIITITAQGSDHVNFTIKQVFDRKVKVLSVYYRDSVGSVECNVKRSVFLDDELPFTAFCIDGVTDVSVYIQIGGDEEALECQNCLAPSATSANTAAFYFKLDCEPVCEPEVATPAEPTYSPSVAPQTPLKAGCYNGVEDATGLNGYKCNMLEGANPIRISEMKDDSVFFTVMNTFSGCAATKTDLAVRFEPFDGDGGLNCYYESRAPGDLMPTVYQAKCHDGIAEVELFAWCSSGQFLGGGSVKSSCSGTLVSCAHLYIVPCKKELHCVTEAPVPTPTNTLLPSSGCQVESMVDQVVKKGPDDPDYPVGAVQVNAFSDGEISFSVTQLWKNAAISWVSVIVDTDGDGVLDDCQKENGFDPNEVNSYVTKCDPRIGFATIQLNLHDGQFQQSNNKNPGVCDGWPNTDKNSKVASYDVTFTCSCSRRLESNPAAVAKEPSTDPDDMPYCLSEDYPCEGDEANMVYVCHYSSRKGYQTFCVPEADSDILRFYSHDYCGPCEGGQGVTWGEMIN